MKKIKRVAVRCFSPCGTTRQVAQLVGQQLATTLEAEYQECSYTLPSEREAWLPFEKDDCVVWASPVYAGRLPNKTLDFVRTHLVGDGQPMVGLVSYGGRSYDWALDELCALAYEGGLLPIGLSAIAGRHVFSPTIGEGRFDEKQLQSLGTWAKELGQGLLKGESNPLPPCPMPERYYRPLRSDGEPANFLKAKPVLSAELCTACGQCLRVCPMGSVATGYDGRPRFEGICIKCQACISSCPQGAIAIEDADFQSHVQMLQQSVCGLPPIELRQI